MKFCVFVFVCMREKEKKDFCPKQAALPHCQNRCPSHKLTVVYISFLTAGCLIYTYHPAPPTGTESVISNSLDPCCVVHMSIQSQKQCFFYFQVSTLLQVGYNKRVLLPGLNRNLMQSKSPHLTRAILNCILRCISISSKADRFSKIVLVIL